MVLLVALRLMSLRVGMVMTIRLVWALLESRLSSSQVHASRGSISIHLGTFIIFSTDGRSALSCPNTAATAATAGGKVLGDQKSRYTLGCNQVWKIVEHISRSRVHPQLQTIIRAQSSAVQSSGSGISLGRRGRGIRSRFAWLRRVISIPILFLLRTAL